MVAQKLVKKLTKKRLKELVITPYTRHHDRFSIFDSYRIGENNVTVQVYLTADAHIEKFIMERTQALSQPARHFASLWLPHSRPIGMPVDEAIKLHFWREDWQEKL